MLLLRLICCDERTSLCREPSPAQFSLLCKGPSGGASQTMLLIPALRLSEPTENYKVRFRFERTQMTYSMSSGAAK